MNILTSNYFLILLWCFVCMYLKQAMNSQETVCVNGEYVRRYKISCAILVFLPLVVWAMFRGNIGDTLSYIRGFQNMPESFAGIPEYIKSVNKDKGFYLFSAIIKCIFGANEYIYLLIIACIQCWFLAYIYRKYSTDYVLSFFLFIVSTDYISWLFNGIRQFLAVTITFACMGLILKKKYLLTIVIILLASQIHGTALIFLPFIFICQGKAWNKKTLLIIASAIIIVIFIGQFTGVLNSMLQETQYENVVSDWKSWNDDGTNPLRVAVYSVPAILSLLGIRIVKTKADSVINLCTNMSIIAVALYVVSIFTSGIFIGRLPIYFSLYSYVLLPWEIENLFTPSSRKLVYMCLIFGYLIFYIYSVRVFF